MPHRVLSHTADTGIEASAATFPALLSELLEGMFGLLDPSGPGEARTWLDAEVDAAPPPDLVVEVLSEALYLSEAHDLLLCDFQLEGSPESGPVHMRVGGVPFSECSPAGPALKAVTYHDLVVERRSDGWFARVYLDV